MGLHCLMGTYKKYGEKLFASAWQDKGNGFSLKEGRFRFCLERNSSLWEWRHTGCLEKLWMPHHWKCSRSDWMELWEAWSSGNCPCPWQSFKVPSTQSFYDSLILGFYDSMTLRDEWREVFVRAVMDVVYQSLEEPWWTPRSCNIPWEQRTQHSP